MGSFGPPALESNGSSNSTLTLSHTLLQHLSKRQKTGCIAVTLVLIIGISAFVYYKWGTEVYADVKDFVIFPTVTTPVDLTSAVMSVVSLVVNEADTKKGRGG